MKRIVSLALAIIFFLPGCPHAVSPSREAYILAGDHGWIELTFIDDEIPGYPRDPEKGDYTPVPPAFCEVEVTVNSEPFLREYVFLTGEEPPFRVDTGFRFAVQVGKIDLRLKYAGCHPTKDDVEDSEIISLNLTFEVKKDTVNQLVYRNGELTNEGFHTEPKVTLQDIDDRLRAIEEKLGVK